MRSSRFGFAGLLLAIGLLLWAIVAWPLPRFFFQAIPYTHYHVENQTVHPLEAGDQLQMLYHFWRGLDALAGHSPWFYNVYEFNLGDDSARLQPNLYYLPFSLVYAAIAPLAGQAAGFNATGLASVLLGVFFTGLLARRFSASPPAVLLATLVAVSFPYRWIVLFTGSPTGFAMAFPPLLAYGLDRAIRDRSPQGGLLAGLAFFFAYASDLHVFYFSALAAPFFAWLSLGLAEPSPRRWPGEIRRLALPLAPFALCAAATLGVGWRMSRHLANTVMASGRTVAEVTAFSPPVSGLFSTAIGGMANHVYIGVPLAVLLAAALVLWALPLFRRGAVHRPALTHVIIVGSLLAALGASVLLALGVYGPFEGLPLRAARRWIPQFTMIRQTVKIYCLLPTFLAILLALLFDGIFRPGDRPGFRRAAIGLATGLVLWTLLQANARTAPGLCRLPAANAAYAAVAKDDVANAGRPPQALALPLWPGDTHWSSLYEYAAMLSRVRLVNGYSPIVPASYFETVFLKYRSLNEGVASDAQLDGLLALGVRHLLFHANAFPDKVSPFPAAATLRALVAHPRLALIADDGQIFAFRILPKRAIEHAPFANWTNALYPSARRWNWTPPLEIANGQSAPLLFRSPVMTGSGLRYLLRLGPGSAGPLLVPPGRDGVSTLPHPVAGLPDWLEAEVPSSTGALVSAISGPVSLQQVLLTAGDLPAPGPDGAIRIAPALLFHVGHSSPGLDRVTFDPETVPARLALHGPDLPFPPGVYDVALSYSLPAGTNAPSPPGIFRVLTLPDQKVVAETPLDTTADVAAFPALTFGADPIRFEFHYTGLVPIALNEIRLTPATLRLRPAAAAP